MKSDFGDDLKELKAAEKDIQKMLPAQVERIDQLYLQQKEWPIESLAGALPEPSPGWRYRAPFDLEILRWREIA